MRKSIAALVAAAVGASALVAGVAAPTVAAADTRDDCYVQLDAPSKVTVDRFYQKLTVSLIDSCGISDSTGIALYGARGFEDGFIFEGNTTETWKVIAPVITLGSLTTEESDSWAFDTDGNDIAIKPTTVQVKLGTKAAVSTKRSGKKVTVKVDAKAWSVNEDSYKAWNASSAKIQYQSGASWKTLKSVKLSKGAASYAYKTSSKRTYRFVVGEDRTHFGATSASSHR